MIATLMLFFSIAQASLLSESAHHSNRAYQDVLLRCSERIWPGIDWRELQLLYSDPESKNAWLISASSPKPELIVKDQTIEDIFEKGFRHGFLEFRGLRTLAVNISGVSPSNAFRVAVRASFVEIGQRDWENPMFDNRGSFYPLLPEPRYYRRMALESFKKAFAAISQNRDPKPFFSNSVYWQRKWKLRYPEELPMRTDSVDGTALYVEQMAHLFNQIGCASSDAEVIAAYQKYILPELTLTPNDAQASEGKVLGAISSFLLNLTQPDWFAKMNGRLMPTDLLVEGLRSEWQAQNLGLREQYTTRIESLQTSARRRLNPTLEKERDPFYIRISIPASWQKGGLSLQPGFVLRNRRDTALMIFDENHDFMSERGRIHIPSQSLVFQTRRNGCGGVFHFLMPFYSVSKVKSRFSGNHWWHRFNLEGKRKTVNGLAWICPRE